MVFAPTDDPWFARGWEQLQLLLRDTGRPSAVDRRDWPPAYVQPPAPVPGDCLVFLSNPDSRFAHPIAGARSLGPGVVLLALCPGWIEPSGGRLLLHCGIWATASGQLYLDDFSPPREVTYFANMQSAPDTLGERCDGDALEPGLLCPTSSALELSRLVSCKVSTRLLAHAAGVRVPRSVALFPEPPPPWVTDAAASPGSPVKILDIWAHAEPARGAPAWPLEWLRERLEWALERWPESITRLVVKPSGYMHLMARGVSFHRRDQLDDLARAVRALLAGVGEVPIAPGDAVLVDEFAGGEELTMRIRSIVCREPGPSPSARVIAMICGIGDSSRPVNGVVAFPQTIEAALANLGGAAPEVAAVALSAQVQRASEDVLLAIARAERPPGDKPRARTDLIGLDFIVGISDDEKGRTIRPDPVMIEVNNHDCTDTLQIYAYTAINPRRPDLADPEAGLLGPYLRGAARRSQAYRLDGRTVLVVGATASKRSVWESARAAGVRVLLAEATAEPPEGIGAELREILVVPDMHVDHSEAGDARSCEAIVRVVAERGMSVDGVVTFIEDCTVLAALVAERLGLRGNGVEAQRVAKSKLATLQALTGPLPYTQEYALPGQNTLAVPFVDIRAPEDMGAVAARPIRFPAVLKQYYGSSAVGTRVVASLHEAEREAARLLALVRDPDADRAYSLCGFSHGGARSGVILMEFIEGSEHDVDIVLFDGELVDAFVTDNGRVEVPCCAELCALMPSALSAERQRQLFASAREACLAIGLRSGVFNVELKLSPVGPKILEVNGRMPGAYIPRWTQAIWEVDLPGMAFMIACGIRPSPRDRAAPRCYLAGVNVFPGDGADPTWIHGSETLVCDVRPPGKPVTAMEYPEPDMSVAVRGASATEAVEHMVALLDALYAENHARGALLAGRLRELVGHASLSAPEGREEKIGRQSGQVARLAEEA